MAKAWPASPRCRRRLLCRPRHRRRLRRPDRARSSRRGLPNGCGSTGASCRTPGTARAPHSTPACARCAPRDCSAAGIPNDVIVCVVDADGRLDRHVLEAVDPYLQRPGGPGPTQIGVRMYNRRAGTAARLQDMEFVVYGDIFQCARRFIGSVGMGGNGQFMRLSALDSLGEDPWSDSLTEDLDLGVRLLARGLDQPALHHGGGRPAGRTGPAAAGAPAVPLVPGAPAAGQPGPADTAGVPGRPAVDLHLPPVQPGTDPAHLTAAAVLLVAFSARIAGSVQAGHSLVSADVVPRPVR